MFVFFLAAYSVLRAVLELFREDDRGGLLGVSTSQWISIVILVACGPVVVRLKRYAASMANGTGRHKLC